MNTKSAKQKPRAKIYNGLWSSWKQVSDRFASQEPQPDEVIYAAYDLDGYSGSAFVFYRNGNRYYAVTGSHCSCMGLEGQWNPERYTLRQAVICFGKCTYGAAFLEGKTKIMRVLTRRLREEGLEHENAVLRQIMR